MLYTGLTTFVVLDVIINEGHHDFKTIAYIFEHRFEPNYVSHKLSTMVDHGILVRTSRGAYDVTKEGLEWFRIEWEYLIQPIVDREVQKGRPES